jgi:thiol-disulfide isomerase/thioredoxin
MADTEERTTSRRPALPWQAWVAATVLAVLAAGAVLWIGAGGDDDSTVRRSDEALSLRPTDEVPDDPLAVELTDLDGTTATLADRLDGRPTVVNFFASWCPPCVKEMPDFDAVHRRLGEQVAFLGVAVTDRPEDVADIVERTGIGYPYSRDVRGDLAGAAEVVQMPSTMFVSATGEIVELHAGAVDADGLRELIEEHLGVVP